MSHTDPIQYDSNLRIDAVVAANGDHHKYARQPVKRNRVNGGTFFERETAVYAFAVAA